MNPHSAANQNWWDSDAERYHREHARYLEGFHWCPEMLTEQELQLLGEIKGRYLELGCGSAPCGAWVRDQGGEVIGIDISMEMLRRADIPRVHGDALSLPFRDQAFDTTFSVFGAIPFIEDLSALFKEVRRVTRGRFIYSVTHPMRWIFPDDPECLEACIPYFEHAYIEGNTYAEFQHTIGDHVRGLVSAGFTLEDIIEPQWPEELQDTWGQWSPKRGKIFPGTAIFLAS